MIRTGIGYDVHQLKLGESLILGGVEIDSDMGSVGHSDGDVLTHAIVDALLGAAGLGDLGTYFPSHDKKWKGTSSLRFLTHTVNVVTNAGFHICNVDGTIMLQFPQLSKYIEDIRTTIAGKMNIEFSAVSIKATTTDGLGFVGRGKGISAIAIATLTFPA